MRTLLPIATIVFVALSCNQNATEPQPTDSPTGLPNRVGNIWTYSFYDSLSNRSDTVTVTIVGQTILPGIKPASVWQKSFAATIDTDFVTIAGDTVRVIPSRNIDAQWDNTKYIFPFFVGQTWQGDSVSDTNSVVENGSVTVISGTFPNTFRLEEHGGAVNSYRAVSTWFVPGVGIIKLHCRKFGADNSNELWELLEYQVLQ